MDALAFMLFWVETRANSTVQAFLDRDPILWTHFVQPRKVLRFKGDWAHYCENIPSGLFSAVYHLFTQLSREDDYLRDPEFILMAAEAVLTHTGVDIRNDLPNGRGNVWDWTGVQPHVRVGSRIRPVVPVSFNRS